MPSHKTTPETAALLSRRTCWRRPDPAPPAPGTHARSAWAPTRSSSFHPRWPSHRSPAHLRDVPRSRPVPGVRGHGRRAVRHLGRSRSAGAGEPAPADSATGTVWELARWQRGVPPEQRRLRARIAANARWSRPMARADQATAARAAIFGRLERQVDPGGLLTPKERASLLRSAGRRLGAELNAARARKRRPVT